VRQAKPVIANSRRQLSHVDDDVDESQFARF